MANPKDGRAVYVSSLFGGGVAGLFVDMILFPLDTLKTRLQAAQGFKKAGGFSAIYKGIGPQALGSAPQAAFFFCTYETFKHFTLPNVSASFHPFVYMAAASIGEVMACLIRVPVEVVKQRRQTLHGAKHTSLRILMRAYKHEGLRGLYRGFGSTTIRDVPFSLIQLPIYEYLKTGYRRYFKNNIPLESWEAAVCGSIASAASAAVTTPLDVVKTRIMLADAKEFDAKTLRIRPMMQLVYRERGMRGLFAGFAPRVLWMTIGGYIYFGMYDLSKTFCEDYFFDVSDDQL